MSGSKTGGCLCGASRFELVEAPTEYGACHCGICRKFSGGIEMGIHVPSGGITWTHADAVRAYPSSEWAERGFCSVCGSSLFWRLTAPGALQGMLSLSVGALDDMKGMKFTTEVYVDAKPKSHSFAGKRKKMTEREVLESVGISDG